MSKRGPIFLAWLCLAGICIIWGTTYTAIKIAIEEFSPVLLAAIRQTSAGLILLAIAWFSGSWRLFGRKYIMQQALAGACMIAGGNGFITWGMQYISSGLSAVIGSLTPVVVTVISLLWNGTQRFHWQTGLGVLFGFVGMAFIFGDGIRDFGNPTYQLGIIGGLASSFTWALGTVMSKEFNHAESAPVMNAGLQVFFGGLVLCIATLLFEPNAHLGTSSKTWGALVYLSLIGSGLAFTLYTYALKHLNATISSLYTYINPIVAILLGWLFLNEQLTLHEFIGMALTILGVVLVNLGSAKAKD